MLTPEEQKKVQALANDPTVLAEVQRDYDLGQKAPLNPDTHDPVTYKVKRRRGPNGTTTPLQELRG